MFGAFLEDRFENESFQLAEFLPEVFLVVCAKLHVGLLLENSPRCNLSPNSTLAIGRVDLSLSLWVNDML